MDILRSLLHPKPEYVFRPGQIWVRLTREFNQHVNTYEDVVLPWGLVIRVRPAEAIGSCIWRLGLYDLCVSETLWRLIDPGDTAVDVGANIGQMTSIMAVRVGPLGHVLAFEPHPDVFAELQANANRWAGMPGTGSIVTRCMALSDRAGQGRLSIPNNFDSNRGLAMLIPDDALNANQINQMTLTVELVRLDETIQSGSIGMLKLDVEGHENEVLSGAERLLRGRQIRDIVFESHACYPTPVTRLLEKQGYRVFKLSNRLFGPQLESPEEHYYQRHRSVDVPSCLATLAPDRALARLRRAGWAVLKQSRPERALVA